MDPTGNLKKVNRYVLRAVSINKTKNKRTFKEICKYVRYYNRNCVPIENLEHSVLLALHNLSEQGLIEKNSKDSFRFRDVSSKKKFQSIINKVIDKSKQKSKNVKSKNHNVSTSTKRNALPKKLSIPPSTSNRNHHRKPNLGSVQSNTNLRLNLKTNSRKRKLSNDGRIGKKNNLRGGKRLKLSSHSNVVNMRSSNMNPRRTKKKTDITNTSFLESASDSDLEYCDNGNFYMYYPSDESEVEDNISYGGGSNKTEESKLETDEENLNEQNDEGNQEEEDEEQDENNDENVSTVNSNSSIISQEEIGNDVNEMSENGQEEKDENNEQSQEVNSNCSTEQNQIENDKKNDDDDQQQYEQKE